jgi:hypothetical protein
MREAHKKKTTEICGRGYEVAASCGLGFRQAQDDKPRRARERGAGDSVHDTRAGGARYRTADATERVPPNGNDGGRRDT